MSEFIQQFLLNDMPSSQTSAIGSSSSDGNFLTQFQAYMNDHVSLADTKSPLSPPTAPLYLTYMFLGSLFSLPYSGLMEHMNVKIVAVRYKTRVIDIGAMADLHQTTLYQQSVVPENRLILRTIDLSKAKSNYAFTEGELVDLADRLNLQPNNLRDFEIDWQILKINLNPATNEISQILLVNGEQANLRNKLIRAVEKVNRFHLNAFEMEQRPEESSEFMQIFSNEQKFEKFQAKLQNYISNDYQNLKEIMTDIFSNIYEMYDKFLQAGSFQASKVNSHAFVTGVFALSFRKRYNLICFVKKIDTNFILKFIHRHRLSKFINFNVPIFVESESLVSYSDSSSELSEFFNDVINSHDSISFFDQMITDAKYGLKVTLNFVNAVIPLFSADYQIVDINQGLLFKLLHNFHFYFNENTLASSIATMVSEELKVILFRLGTGNKLLLPQYILGEMFDLQSNKVADLLSLLEKFQYKHIQFKDVTSFFIKSGPKSWISFNIYKQPDADQNLAKRCVDLMVKKCGLLQMVKLLNIDIFLPTSSSSSLVLVRKIYTKSSGEATMNNLESIQSINTKKFMELIRNKAPAAEFSNMLSPALKEHPELLRSSKNFDTVIRGIFHNYVTISSTRSFLALADIQEQQLDHSQIESIANEAMLMENSNLVLLKCGYSIIRPAGALVALSDILKDDYKSSPMYSTMKTAKPITMLALVSFRPINTNKFQLLGRIKTFADTLTNEHLKADDDKIPFSVQHSCIEMRKRRKREPTDCDTITDKQMNKESGKIAKKSEVTISGKVEDTGEHEVRAESGNINQVERLTEIIESNRAGPELTEMIKFGKDIIKEKELSERLAPNPLVPFEPETLPKWVQHLQRIRKYAGYTMLAQIGKDIFGNAINEDWGRVAYSTSLLAGIMAMYEISAHANMQGLKLILNERVLFGKMIRATCPFLTHGITPIIIADLIGQIKIYKVTGDEQALIAIVGDSIWITADVTEVGIELYEIFSGITGIAAITGPALGILTTIIYVGSDTYKIVKKMKRMNELVHLTGYEKFTEGTRAFFHINPSQRMQYLMKKAEEENKLMKQMSSELLKNLTHDGIKRYVLPTLEVEYDCRWIHVYEAVPVFDNPFHPHVGRASTTERLCDIKTIQAEDNVIDMSHKSLRWSRIWPENEKYIQLLCVDSHHSQQTEVDFSKMIFTCDKAMGIENTMNITGNVTMFKVFNGTDKVIGFYYSPNIFILGNGKKLIHGGSEKDVFILNGDSTTGNLHGYGGDNLLNLQTYSIDNKIELKFEQDRGMMKTYIGTQNHQILNLSNITRIVGCENKGENLECSCSQTLINLLGGKNDNELDEVNIPDLNCTYKMSMHISSFTRVINNASSGLFVYSVTKEANGTIDIYLSETQNATHEFHFDFSYLEICRVDFSDNANNDSKSLKLDLYSFTDKSRIVNLTISNVGDHIVLLFDDNAQLKIHENKFFIIKTMEKLNAELAILMLPKFAQWLNVTYIVKSTSRNETLLIGHAMKEYKNETEYLTSNETFTYHCNVMKNEPNHETHMCGGYSQNMYDIILHPSNNISDVDSIEPIGQVNIYHLKESKFKDLVDLSSIRKKLAEADIKLKVDISSMKTYSKSSFVLNLIAEQSDLSKHFATITLNTMFGQDSSKNFLVKLKGTLEIKKSVPRGTYQLNPLPCVFQNDTELIIIDPNDVDANTTLVIPRDVDQLNFYHYKDFLIISNVKKEVHSDKDNDFISIMLKNFYSEKDLQSLKVHFNNLTIDLAEDTVKAKINNQAVVSMDLIFDTLSKRYPPVFAQI